MPIRSRRSLIKVNAPDEWPERGDQFIVYHQTYGGPGRGFWYFDEGEYQFLGTAPFTAQLVQYVILQGLTVNLQWDDNTDTLINPANGAMKGNNNNLSGVTEFSASNEDFYGRALDDDARWVTLKNGDFLAVSDREKLSFYVYTLTADPIDAGAATRIPVTGVQGQSVNPGAGDLMEVKWQPIPAV